MNMRECDAVSGQAERGGDKDSSENGDRIYGP